MAEVHLYLWLDLITTSASGRERKKGCFVLLYCAGYVVCAKAAFVSPCVMAHFTRKGQRNVFSGASAARSLRNGCSCSFACCHSVTSSSGRSRHDGSEICIACKRCRARCTIIRALFPFHLFCGVRNVGQAPNEHVKHKNQSVNVSKEKGNGAGILYRQR